MKIRTFKRGVNPPKNKHHTNKLPITEILPEPGEHMRYALKQHIGEPCVPVVKTGERVYTGQKIADSDARISSPVHSSVSGIVRGFTDTMTVFGRASYRHRYRKRRLLR
jgi:electron transport complex protein RnfC